MLYRVTADLVLVLHLLFILFAVLGGLLVLKWRWVAWLHFPAALWAAMIEFAGWYCPLTPLENSLRAAGGQQGYSGGFIEHYLVPLIYPAGLTRELQIGLGMAVVLINLAVYGILLRRIGTARRGAGGPR
ncbi:MAG: DUF2784 domain-containing protein [Thiogranum sp.]|nr:DUF2784 domain-containing protein [Thiogranum sp.]